MWFFEMWAGLNTWFKVGLSLCLLLVSTILWLTGTFWPWGWVAGVILLIFSFPNDAQRKGYHDF